uniref:Mitotic spindle assembly checkpoint protein MAD1 n=3 Tax=Tetraselmis sp. GSL018 TaxID=582737 RepID=A0A061R603_9CHLO
MASEASSRGAGTGAATSFVLRPAKADSKDDHLVFRFTQAGGMEIQETPFTAQPSRQQEVQTFIAKFRSIPAFTANLTMELFQKQTQC